MKRYICLLLLVCMLTACGSKEVIDYSNDFDPVANFEELDKDETYKIYSNIIDDFKENDSFEIQFNFLINSSNDEAYEAVEKKWDYKVNDYFNETERQAVLEFSSRGGFPLTIYLKDSTHYMISGDKKNKNEAVNIIMYECFMFTKVEEKNIIKASIRRENGKSDILLSVNTDKDFLANTTLTKADIMNNQMDILLTYDSNYALEKITMIHSVESDDKIYKVVAKSSQIKYGHQEIGYPEDLEDWQ